MKEAKRSFRIFSARRRKEIKQEKVLAEFEAARIAFIEALAPHMEEVRRIEVVGMSRILQNVTQEGDITTNLVKRQKRELVITATRTARGVDINFNSRYEEFIPGSLQSGRYASSPRFTNDEFNIENSLDIVSLDETSGLITGISSGNLRRNLDINASGSERYFAAQAEPVVDLPAQTAILNRTAGYFNLKSSSGRPFQLT